MTVQQREPSCFMALPAGGTAATAAVLRLAAAPCTLAPSALSFGLPLPACPMVRCLPAEDTPGTPSAASPAAVDRSSPPPPVDTPSVHFERRPTSRFDALFMAAQQELGSVRPPSVQPTRLTGSPAAAKRTQQGSSSSSSSGSGTTRRTRLARAAAPSRLANVSKGCTKPRRSSTVAARRQAVLQAKRQPQEAALAHVQRQPAAVVVNARSADRLRRVIVMRALVSALLQAPAIAPASCHAQHVASKLAPLLPAGQRPEEQRQLEEARRFLQLF